MGVDPQDDDVMALATLFCIDLHLPGGLVEGGHSLRTAHGGLHNAGVRTTVQLLQCALGDCQRGTLVQRGAQAADPRRGPRTQVLRNRTSGGCEQWIICCTC
jgi:hypothetical protein